MISDKEKDRVKRFLKDRPLINKSLIERRNRMPQGLLYKWINGIRNLSDERVEKVRNDLIEFYCLNCKPRKQ